MAKPTAAKNVSNPNKPTARQSESQPAVTETAAAAPALEPVQLTVADLQVLAKIVDLASRRGAFQAAELSQVGDAFNKLAGFLSYVESTQKKEEQPEEPAPAA